MDNNIFDELELETHDNSSSIALSSSSLRYLAEESAEDNDFTIHHD